MVILTSVLPPTWMQQLSFSPMRNQTSTKMNFTPFSSQSSQLSGHEWLESSMKMDSHTSTLSYDLVPALKRVRISDCSTSWDAIPISKCHETSRTCWNTFLRQEISKITDRYLQRKISTKNLSDSPRAVIAMDWTSALWRTAYLFNGANTFGGVTQPVQETYWQQVRALNACSCNNCSTLANQLWSSDQAALARRHGRNESLKSQHY